jgi:hypothetical protein
VLCRGGEGCDEWVKKKIMTNWFFRCWSLSIMVIVSASRFQCESLSVLVIVSIVVILLFLTVFDLNLI